MANKEIDTPGDDLDTPTVADAVDDSGPAPGDPGADDDLPEDAQAEHGEDDQPDQTGPQEDSASNREKLYRLQAREAQSSLAMVSDKLRAAQRQIVDHRIAGRIRDPEAFWQHNELHDLLDENSDLDNERVDQAASDLLTAKSYLAVPSYAATPNSDGKIGIPEVGVLRSTAEDPTTTWTEVLRAAAQGGG